jgi:hypothetical protein
MALRISSVKGDTGFRLPLALACSSLCVAGHLFFYCTQYAAGSKEVCFPALPNEILELSGLHMIRANHCSEAIESLSPPVVKGDRIKVGVKHNPAGFYQIVDCPLDGHGFLPLSIIRAVSLSITAPPS